MAAYRPPVTIPGSVIVNPTAKKSERIAPAATSLVETVLHVAGEVTVLFNDVPYVKVFTGILLHVIKIREEIQTEKDRSQELIDKILRRSKVILDGLVQVTASPSRNQLKDTEEKLGEYNRLLEHILSELTTKAPRGVRGKFDQFVNRNSKIETLAKCDRLIDDFNTDFITDLLLKLRLTRLQAPQLPSGPASILYKPIPRPGQMIGRDKEKSIVTETLLHHTLPRVAILGVGGMGKTTLALTILHDQTVIERYSLRYFVSCEAVTSLSSLIWEIANSLRIPVTERNEHLIETILSSFHERSILCLDNFEAIWEGEENRQDLEDFLSHLDHLPQLAIVMTIRGAQRPYGVSWSSPLLPLLKKLNNVDSISIFEKTCIPVDEFAEKLLHVADGIPLAIKLIIAQLQEEGGTAEHLWTRWEQTQTEAIGTGRKHRLSNLEASIHLSVYSPRMRADPSTIPVFAMLSSLPDGFPCRQEAVERLQTHLPEHTRLQRIMTTLQLASLVHVDGAEGSLRYRMLVPIREFGIKLHVKHSLTRCLATFYAEMMNRFTNYANPAGHLMVPPELPNIRSVFVKALGKKHVDQKIVRASIHYTLWCIHIGNPTSKIINMAKRKAADSSSLYARCVSALSRVYLAQNKLGEAESSFKKAIEHHRRLHDVSREANDTQRLGQVYYRCDKLNKAEKAFKKALKLHRQSRDVRGEANDVRRLGEVYFRLYKYDDAELFFKQAIVLHRQSHDVLGEAIDIQKLGQVYFRRGQLDEAESSFRNAMKLHRELDDLRGEANDLRKLGEVHFRQDKLDEAESFFQRALELHRQSHDVMGEANDIQKLGGLLLQRGNENKAKSCFKKAIELHRQLHDLRGEGNDLRMLGDVYLRQGLLDDAESSIKTAIELHQQSNDKPSEANDIQKLGEAYFRRGGLSEAENLFKRAMKLNRESHNVGGEANDFQKLGEVYCRWLRLDEAEQCLNQARLLHRQCQSSWGEAVDLQLLEQVQNLGG